MEKLFITSILERCDHFASRVSNSIDIAYMAIVGSHGKGTARTDSDIDIIMIVNDIGDIGRIEDRFRDFYSGMHLDFSLPPDDLYPGEIISLSCLGSAHLKCLSSDPRMEVSDDVFDGLVWSAMIFDQHIPVRCDVSVLKLIVEQSKAVLDHFRRGIAPDVDIVTFVKEIKKYITHGVDCNGM